MRVKIGGDFSKLLLLKAHYHKKCYAACIKSSKLKSDDVSSLYEKAFENFATCFEKIMEYGKALRMDTAAYQKYQQNLTDAGVKMRMQPGTQTQNWKLGFSNALEILSGLLIKNIKMSLKLYTAVSLTSKS